MSEAQQSAEWFQGKIAALREAVGQAVVGQDEVVEGVLVCLAADGHALLEGMPGLGKTLLVRTLSAALSLDFSRIQFTPDMMPADVTGTNVLATEADGQRRFEFRKGPIFSNLVLADEINRATPKTQSAMLEAMQERQATVGGTAYALPQPFLVMATQNPVEQEGTYPLPEAQLDRFFYKLLVPYPSKEDLEEVVRRTTGTLEHSVEKVATPEDIETIRQTVKQIEVPSSAMDFAMSVIVGTHPEGEGRSPIAEKYCRYGSSPRGAQTLITAGKVYALMDGRFHVSKDDVKRAAKPALRHRLLLNFEAEADSVMPDDVIDEVLAHVESTDRDPVTV